MPSIDGEHVGRPGMLPATVSQALLMRSQAGRAVDAFERCAPALQRGPITS